MECFFDEEDVPDGTEKLHWVAEHRPLSISVSSNVPGHDGPKCFISDGDSSQLVSDMMAYLKEIRETAYSLMSDTYSDVISVLETKRKEMIEKEPAATGEECTKPHPLTTLQNELDEYLKELPVIGFNSGKYDMNVMKVWLISYIKHKQQDIEFVVKKGNDIMCLKTGNLKFLDIINYLAPGFSYDKFLKAYGASVTKGFLPYEWINSLSKLDETKLPAHEAFHSKLKNSNISEDDYEYCQQLWIGMTTFRDFLVWYNNRDVQAMLEALQNVFKFYKDRRIDMFKDGISVPGLTLKYLFSHLDKERYFTVFDRHNGDLYHLIRDEICGGPALIFNRYHEKGVTKIRESDYGDAAKDCEAVVGWDANSLYLWAISQDMPTGWHIRRRAENNFRPETVQKYGRQAAAWLDWVECKNGIEIRHQQKSPEKRIRLRGLPVDGWCKETQTVYQFHGCLFHGHKCRLTRDRNGEHLLCNPISNRPMRELREETAKNTDYIRKLGYRVVELWECEWKAMIKNDHTICEFVNEFHSNERTGAMTEADIVASVTSGTLFGLVECDISVPDRLKPLFSEMQPIFKNTDITRDDIGEFMKSYAEEHNIMSRPRRSLIGSFYGEKILLATPLLKWYLEQGLVVTKIYQVLEYTPKPCFKSFADNVSDARRKGDVDESTKIVAETMKLIGNSAYGKTITNVEKHRDVLYVTEDEVSKLINEPTFRQLNPLADDVYEIEMSKKKLTIDLPLQIGYFVYQYAKLRMLEFYYDFIDVYVDRRDFEYCEMDTDSAYIALSARSLDEVVKPDTRELYYSDIHRWLPAASCDIHRSDFVETNCKGDQWEIKECCKARQVYDKRTPGLFKEWSGDGIIGLCSKTYYCFGDRNKATSKGINKNQNELTKQTSMSVLETKASGSGVNIGFRIHNNTMFTSTQARDALSYFYPKRKVANDGRSTTPMDI